MEACQGEDSDSEWQRPCDEPNWDDFLEPDESLETDTEAVPYPVAAADVSAALQWTGWTLVTNIKTSLRKYPCKRPSALMFLKRAQAF